MRRFALIMFWSLFLALAVMTALGYLIVVMGVLILLSGFGY